MERVLKKDPTDTLLNIRAMHDQTVKFDEEDDIVMSQRRIGGGIREPEPEVMPE